jgi:glycine cleavage system H protein
MGITEHGVREIGSVASVSFHRVGDNFALDEIIGTLETVEPGRDETSMVEHPLHMPVSGRIAKVNAHILALPELINREPYGRGWILMIDVANDADTSGWMRAEVYDQFVAGHRDESDSDESDSDESGESDESF